MNKSEILVGLISSVTALAIGAALLFVGAIPKLQDGRTAMGWTMAVLAVLAIVCGVAGLVFSYRKGAGRHT